MALSRYRNVNSLEGKFFESINFPPQDQLDAVPAFQIVVSKRDRLDNLAFKHLGAGEYWWVIALMNGIQWSFGLEDGQILRVPLSVEDVLRLV